MNQRAVVIKTQEQDMEHQRDMNRPIQVHSIHHYICQKHYCNITPARKQCTHVSIKIIKILKCSDQVNALTKSRAMIQTGFIEMTYIFLFYMNNPL